MYKVSQRRGPGGGRHPQRALAQEGGGGARHGRQVVHHAEHLDERAVRVEQRHLHGAGGRDAVAAGAEVNMTLEINI